MLANLPVLSTVPTVLCVVANCGYWIWNCAVPRNLSLHLCKLILLRRLERRVDQDWQWKSQNKKKWIRRMRNGKSGKWKAPQCRYQYMYIMCFRIHRLLRRTTPGKEIIVLIYIRTYVCIYISLYLRMHWWRK